MPSNPQTLFEQSKCFACYGLSEGDLLRLALLDGISQGGIPASCANLEGAEADPTGIYTPEFIGQVYVTSGHVWQSTGLTSADWTEICNDAPSTAIAFENVTFDEFKIGGDIIHTEFLFPNLTDIPNGVFAFGANTALTTLSAPLLVTTDDTITFNDCTSLTTVDLSSLQTCLIGFLFFYNCPLLTTLLLPSLVTVGSNVDGNGCTSLTTFSVPAWLPTNGTAIDLNGCALLAASVNQILARCVAAGVTTCVIDLSGGTNAAPTGQGIVDKADLITAGNTVTTN